MPPDATATATIDGPAASVTTTVAGQNAEVFFDGTANQVVSWLFSNVTTGDVNIYKPDGSLLRGASQVGSGTFFEPLTLPVAGTYKLTWDPYATSTGSLSVQVTTVPPDATATATIDGPAASVTTTVAGQNAKVFFDGTANQVVSWLFSNVTTAGDVNIYKPDGSLLRGASQVGSGTFFEPLTLPVAGTYKLTWDPYATSTGSLSVQVTTVPPDATATATIDGPAASVTTTVAGQNAKVFFDGTANQVVSWLFSNVTTAGDVRIYKPDGSLFRGNQQTGSGTAYPAMTLPVTGTYQIYFDPYTTSTGSLSVQVSHGTGFVPVDPAGQPARVVLAAFGSPDQTPISPLHFAPPAHDRTREVTSNAKPPAAPPPTSSGPEEWRPAPGTFGKSWSTGRPHSIWEDQPPLRAAKGVTALSGLVLNLAGDPMADVTLSVDDTTVVTDATGRFLLKAVGTGRRQLHIDGRTANKPGRTYGTFEVGVEVQPHATTVLPYTIWMPKLDTAHVVKLPAVITTEIVVTTPYIPGLELHIPPGSKIVDEDGKPVTEISITPIPVDRPPFFLPANVEVPIYFTIQPGGAYVQPSGAWLVYPNYQHKAPGTRVGFWHYDPDVKDWYTYGHGTVSPDGSQVKPDPGVRIWEFTGAMIDFGWIPAALGWLAGGGEDGDPVDMATGLFVLRKTDLVEPGLPALDVTRTYRQGDNTSRAFGIGTDFTYGLYLYSANQYQEADLVLPGSGKVHYVRTSSGTGYVDAVFTSTATPTAFYASTIAWNGNGWNLRTNDGTVYVFGENAPLQSIRDRYGNAISLTRTGGAAGNITRVSSSSGRWLTFAYDTSNRITSATDNLGRTVGYQYDATGRLWKVTDPAGGVTEYTYNASNQMTALKDARLITFLQNQYDANGRVSLQTQADNSTYQFAYTTDGNGKVTQTDITDPRGIVRRVTFNASGYPLTDTAALGRPEQRTITFVRQASGNLPTSVTDALGRRTDYAYDTLGNVTSVTRLAGTANAVTTGMTYEPAFGQVASITDPLNHTTRFAYDSAGNLTTVTDPRLKDTTFTYNAAGQPLTSTDSTNKTTHFTYLLGDLVGVTGPLGRTTSQFVDAAGRVQATTDPLAERTRTDFDLLNRPTRTIDPLGNATGFTYDANGNVLTVTDGRTNVDTSAPSAPTNVVAVPSAWNSVALTWAPSTDNVAVARYAIYRGGVQVSVVAGTVASFTDRATAPSTAYSYTVKAFDAAGNAGPISASAPTTTPACASCLVTTTFTPTADAYVDNSSGQSNKNFGTATTLLVANSGDKKSYLLFNVTGLPAGTISGATLRVFATVADAAGFAAHSSATTSWTETGIKYNNAPTYSASLGTSGAVTANNWASVGVSAAVTSTGLKTLVIDKNGTSNGTYQSREGTNRPQLLVSVATPPPVDSTAPTAPAGLSAAAISGSQIILAWTGSTDAVGVQGYKIYRDGTYLASVGPVGSTSLSDTGLASSTAYSYRVSAIDAAGNESAQSAVAATTTGMPDPASNVTTYTYDVMDRVASRTDPLGHGETFGYDVAGHPTTATDRKGLVTSASYDALGRRTFVGFNTVINGGSTTYESTITTTFDAADRATQLVDSGAGTITYGYDGLDRVTSETTPQGSVTYAYDDAGRRTRMTLAGQPDVTYMYDIANRMTGISQASSSVGFTYDDAGRQLTLTLPNGIVGTYGYDDASETTSISYAQGATAVGDLAYAYDLAGRRATVSGSLARTGLPVAVASATYNADNQLTSWGGSTLSYDQNGNVLSDGPMTYTWNARNELTQIKTGQTVTASFAYDATGRRSTKTIAGAGGSFAYDGANVTQEQAAGSPIANALTGGTDEVFSRTDASGARAYLTDALGSTVALADGTGAISTSYTYDPFGATTSSGTTSTNATQFTGRENDGTGLYFYRARYYSPIYGRFLSEDPAGFVGSGANPYWYAGDNPVNATDPSGEILPLIAACGVGAIFGIVSDLIFNAVGHRKTNLGDLAGAAVGGCLLGLGGFGLVRAVSGAAPIARAFASLSRAEEFGVWPYRTLRMDLKGLGLEAHHLLEKRFATTLGQKASEMASIAVSKAEHQIFTNAWNVAIRRGTTGSASRTEILDAARSIYRDYPDILKALGL